MGKESLFQILSRQPWWITVLVAFVIFWIAYAIFPPVAPFAALPFGLLAIYIAIKQWRSGTPANAGERLAEIRGMPWETFSAAVAEAFRRQGYHVAPADGQGFDFRLTKDGRVFLLQCRRWKVNQVGEGPVRELAAAVERAEASRGLCLAAGDFSEPARKLAAREPVTLISGPALVTLLGRVRRVRT